MNERIQELAEQCIDPKWTVTGPMFDREKFAELIVRECARVYWNIDDGEIHGEYVNALKNILELKNELHFIKRTNETIRN